LQSLGLSGHQIAQNQVKFKFVRCDLQEHGTFGTLLLLTGLTTSSFVLLQPDFLPTHGLAAPHCT